MRKPLPYPIFPDALSEEGYWLFRMEEDASSIDQVELEQRALRMRFAPLLEAAVEELVAVGELTWRAPEGYRTHRALCMARKLLDILKNGAEEYDYEAPIIITPPGDSA